jgi:predicted aldo/keto reductase-like oxidoreductase
VLVQYRHFGSLDYKPSALGFGTMRLPLLPTDSPEATVDFTRVDRRAATDMLHWAVDHGVNYVDTGWDYHRGASESWLADALSGGYRERVKLATKLPVWMVESVPDCDSYLDRQLERLNTPSIDFYLFHALERVTWRSARDLGALEWAQGAKADGRIGHIGFSFHDDYDIFTEIIDAGEGVWEFCQIQLNYMDVEHQAGLRGMRYAAERGLGVVVMEPVRGGRLAKEPPPAVDALWTTAPRPRGRAEWALQWVWNLPEVSLALSGMNTMEHVRQNVEYAGRSAPGSLSAEELAIVDRVRAWWWTVLAAATASRAPMGSTYRASSSSSMMPPSTINRAASVSSTTHG